ncbi:MAG: hypothetical protein WA655_22115 [Candidatus Korobacteraceae bacterium]
MSIATSRANELEVSPVGVNARARILLFVAMAIIVAITAVRTWIWWKNDAGISFASGVMITMAADLTHGVFYRPLFGPIGYGGTRYFPLYFCLQALLLKLGMPVLGSAYLLSAAAIGLLMWATFRLLRELGVETWLAACAALMLLAASSVQLSLTTPQADGLAAALNVFGLAVIARTPRNRRRVLLAALLFTLAWSAKLTTVFGLAAAIVWLLVTGCKRAAWLLAAESLCGYAAVAVATIAASGGRVVEIFRACASGGTDWRFILSGPLRMQSMALYTDPILVVFAVLGLVVLAVLLVSSQLLRSLPAWFLMATIAVTIVIFGSPGTAGNHLLDVQVAAVILLATWVAKAATPQRKQWGVYALALLTVIAAFLLWRNVRTWSRWYHPHQFQQVIAAIGPSDKPILAENPIIPVLAGQQPYVIDPWMVQLLRTHFPGFQEPLLERLRNQDFNAVVLTSGNIAENGAQRWFDTNSFGPGFVAALNDHYKLAGEIDKDWIYLPRDETSQKNGAKFQGSSGGN